MSNLKPAVDVCLVVLVGLPGSGKTTLVNFMKEHFSFTQEENGFPLNIIHICYDQLIHDHFFHQKYTDLESKEWHDFRQEIYRMVEKTVCLLKNIYSSTQQETCSVELISDSSNKFLKQACKWDVALKKPVAIVIDDNMYYRSMRYTYFQLARIHNIGFCQVCLNSSLTTAINFNNQRCQNEKIPETVIQRMAEKIELPLNKPWEQYSLILPSPVLLSNHEIIHQLRNLILESLCNPVETTENSFEVVKKSRQECRSNMIHQADLALRRLIREQVRMLQADMADSNQIQKQSHTLNVTRTKIIGGLKSGALVIPEQIHAAVQCDHPLAQDTLCTFLVSLLPQ